MTLSCTIVSIGALSRNRFWGENEARRAAHATTTLIRDGKTTLLIDPGLPGPLLAQRLDERCGLKPEQVDAVFLTSFRPVHRRSLELFDRAAWMMNEREIEAMNGHLKDLQTASQGGGDPVDADLQGLLDQERTLLGRIRPAPDKLMPRVHLFPCPGATPGSAGLLIEEGPRTTIIAGDAVVSRDYFEAGRVFEQVFDLAAAQESLRDIIEVADLIVPGHDNLFLVSGR